MQENSEINPELAKQMNTDFPLVLFELFKNKTSLAFNQDKRMSHSIFANGCQIHIYSKP